LSVLADLNTSRPGGGGANFADFSDAVTDGYHTVFFGNETAIPPVRGLYTDITGTLAELIGPGDLLDGRAVTNVLIGGESIDGNRIGFFAAFLGGTRGLYLATYPAEHGDVDEDGDVDLFDWSLLQNCFDPEAELSSSSTCRRADFNGDTVVNLRDVDFGHVCLGGPEHLPGCEN